MVAAIILLRHGQTDYNAEGRFQGQEDIPLNALGRSQAEAAAQALSASGIDRIVSSDLRRAHETAEALSAATGAGLEFDARLREISVGEWQGRTRDEIAGIWPEELAAWFSGADMRPPGGESRRESSARVVTAIRDIVQAIDISDARMERGNVRCDANVSLMPKGATEFGTRTETKNVNSTRAVQHAVTHEIQRQAAVLAAGGTVTQETRHWHEDTRSTTSGRPKSDADDYRYFPEPDLVPVHVDAAWVERVRAAMPELPAVRNKRLKAEWGFSDEEFRDVVNAGVLDEIVATVEAGASAAAARKWWMGEIARLANVREVAVAELGITPAHVVEVEELIAAKTINDKIAKQVLGLVADGEGAPKEVVAAKGLAVVSDDGALTEAVDAAIAANPDVAEKIKGGKMAAVGALIGPVMKATRGQADAGRVREIVLERLGVS